MRGSKQVKPRWPGRLPPDCSLKTSLNSPEAQLALCYPDPGIGCLNRIKTLEALGIKYLCSYGPSTLPGTKLRVLGKGHAAVVTAALFENIIVAVKARRIDSKRSSLLWEAQALAEASKAGVAPKLVYWNDDLIVMELITGPKLGDLLESGEIPPWALIEALKAARTLDVIEIEHLELSRPWRNVVFTGGHEKAKALIIDYESSRKGCGNVLRILGGLLPAINVNTTDTMRESLAEYKRNCDKNAYYILERELINLLEPFAVCP